MPPPPSRHVVSCSVALSLCARSCCQLAVAAVRLPALLCCEAMLWAVAFLTFPLRLLAAVDGERKLGRVVEEMQGQMERLVRENRELEERLRAALREHDAMDEILDEMEEEHAAALATIRLLERQVRALEQEKTRLAVQRGKSMWDKQGTNVPPPSPSWREGTGGDGQQGGGGAAEAAAERRQAGKAVARRRSLFSLGMSVAVGAAVWWAEAPCLPLLAALFAVVGVSMCSVARTCRPATDAVALLGLNCFLLGVLAYPMLPRAATLALAGLPFPFPARR